MLNAMPRFNKRARRILAAPLVFLFAVAMSAGLLVGSPAHASVATLAITDSAGTALTSFSIGSKLYVTVTDADKNTDASTKQKINATITSGTAGDSETLDQAVSQLEETGVNTGVFRNPGLNTDLKSGTVTANDSTLEIEVNDTITATYTDQSSETTLFDFADSPLNHTSREAAHVDDGSAGGDDPDETSCGDTAVYTGSEAGIAVNTATNGGYIPLDSADWDFQPGSNSSNGGPTTSNIATDNNVREENSTFKDNITCHGWDIHEFTFDLSPYTTSSLSSLDIDWAGASTYGGPVETQDLNDAILLIENRTDGQWELLDTQADIAVLEGGSITDVQLTAAITTNFNEYLDSNGAIRLVVAGYDSAADTLGGALYTDYISVNAEGADIATDSITIGGGSIFGTVWNDKDRDGKFDSAEPGLSGVSVTLRDNNGTALVTDTTDSNGDYGFIGFPAGTYRLHETDPSGYTSTTTNDLGPLTLAAGQTITNQDFGDAQQLSTTGLTSGAVWMTFAGVVAIGTIGWFGTTRVRKFAKARAK